MAHGVANALQEAIMKRKTIVAEEYIQQVFVVKIPSRISFYQGRLVTRLS
ncbi:hypothetical protein KCP73_23400 [Salmonella enterica subsp. enterica]|nr:hypothetical protein KCP73_23400 [Salmonella enterica subsp. enterica]